MGDYDKDLGRKLADSIAQLPDIGKSYLVGCADGMALAATMTAQEQQIGTVQTNVQQISAAD